MINKKWPEGNAVIYCEGAFNTTYGKTAHGLIRFCRRYQVAAVVDSRYAGQDAGFVLDGRANNIPVFATIEEAVETAHSACQPLTHMVIGIAPDGGGLDNRARTHVLEAIGLGLNIDSGLHYFLSEDPGIAKTAAEKGVTLRDIRKPPPRHDLHFFSGKIEEVKSKKIAVLGSDSAIGKRTTAWLLVDALNRSGHKTEMIGTGQTAWMQGARYGVIMDSLVNDFVSGEIEHVVWSAWNDGKPDVIVIEGQGSLMNPAFPGGFEILAAGRPDMIVLQHAPARKEYDGFPGFPIQPLSRQIEAVEMISGKPVVAVTVNHEGMSLNQVPAVCDTIRQITGLPTFDVLYQGAEDLAKVLMER